VAIRRRGALGDHTGVLGRLRFANVLHDFEDLPFDDAADAIQIGAALAFNFVGVGGLAAQPKNEADNREQAETGERRPLVPIF